MPGGTLALDLYTSVSELLMELYKLLILFYICQAKIYVHW